MKNKKSALSLIVIISGLSGSGKTVALRALEDSNFFCVDNLPIDLIDSFISIVTKNTEIKKIGIGIDIREKGFLSGINTVLKNLRAKYSLEVIFLEAENDVLIRRFRETRRPHPLGGNIEEAIKIEKKHLSILKDAADKIIDTSSYTPHQLRELIKSLYQIKIGKKSLTVTIISFGFKFGVPQNIDLLFDARFLPNPNFVTELKPLTGLHKKVSDYVFKYSTSKKFFKKLSDLIDFLIPLYIKEGRAYLNIAIGCTGGNHRSPAIAVKLYKNIRKHPVDLNIIHRDIK